MNTVINVLTVVSGVALYFFTESLYYTVRFKLHDRRVRLEVAAHEEYIRALASLNKNQRVKKTVQRF